MQDPYLKQEQKRMILERQRHREYREFKQKAGTVAGGLLLLLGLAMLLTELRQWVSPILNMYDWILERVGR